MSTRQIDSDGTGRRRASPCAFCDWVRSLFLGHVQTRKRSRTVFNDLFRLMKTGHDRSWSDDGTIKGPPEAYVLEVSMLEEMSEVELAARIQALRRNLREMMVAHDYIELIKQIGTFSRSEAGSKQQLKLEARALLDRTYRRYLLVPKVEQMRATIGLRLLLVIGLMTTLTMGVLVSYYAYGQQWIGEVCFGYLLPVLSGCIGAAISTLMRLHKMDPRRDPLMVWMSLHRGEASIWMSPVLGAIFGLIMLLVLRSGIISGAPFPEFDGKYWELGGFHKYLIDCFGATSEENEPCRLFHRNYMALIVWCFVAGWAERLVPDVLDRLSSQGRSQIKGTGGS